MSTSSSTSSSAAVSGPPWSPTAERIAIVAFWLFLAALELLRSTVNPFRPAAQLGPVAYVGAGMYIVWAMLTPAIFWLARRLPLDPEASARRLIALVGAGLVVAMAVELLNFALIRVLLDPANLPVGPGRPRPSELSPVTVLLGLWFLDEFLIFLAVLAVGFARNYFIRLREREREAAQLQAEAANLQAQLADARLSALRMQLNPHFLFNTLHSISSLADEDPEAVQRIVARLSALLRRTLESTGKQEVPLAEEFSFLRDYLDIQRVRFDERLEVVEQVDSGVLEALVPNLILQPLVENAIKHGTDQISGDTARIVLGAHRDAESDRLVLSVRDNGPGIEEGVEERAIEEGGVGLANTRARLEGLYGEDAALTLANAPEGGLVATITLPYHTAADIRSIPRA